MPRRAAISLFDSPSEIASRISCSRVRKIAGLRAFAIAQSDPLESALGNLAAEKSIAGIHCLNRQQQVLRRGALQEVATGAGAQHAQQVFRTVIKSQDQDLHSRHFGLQPVQRLETAHLRHVDVQHYHVRRQFPGLTHGVFAVCGKADDFDVLITGEAGANTINYDRMIVDEQTRIGRLLVAAGAVWSPGLASIVSGSQDFLSRVFSNGALLRLAVFIVSSSVAGRGHPTNRERHHPKTGENPGNNPGISGVLP